MPAFGVVFTVMFVKNFTVTQEQTNGFGLISHNQEVWDKLASQP